MTQIKTYFFLRGENSKKSSKLEKKIKMPKNFLSQHKIVHGTGRMELLSN